jgi:large subunit ribosomal protein L12
MEQLYAALLLHKAGHPVNEANMRKVLEAAGAKINEGQIKAVVAALEGANIDEIISKASAMAVAPAAHAGPAPAAEKKEEKKEEKKVSEEEASAGLSALFG